MNDLSPKVNALLELGRLGDDPTEVEVASNRSALAGKLGAAALGASAALGTTKQATAAASVGTWTTTKVALLCGAVAIGGATTWGVVQYAGGTPHGDARTMPTQAPVQATIVQPTIEVPALSIVEQPESPITPVATPAASTAIMPGTAATSKTAGALPARSIGDELKLVRGAQQHLNRGESRAALSLLSEHARRFPSGVLWEEREASRVLALCGLGNREAARALADEFIRRVPRSAFVDRVRAACREPSPSGSP